jgi:hypothetical protein
MLTSNDLSTLPDHCDTSGRAQEDLPPVAGLPMISSELQNAENWALAQLP